MATEVVLSVPFLIQGVVVVVANVSGRRYRTITEMLCTMASSDTFECDDRGMYLFCDAKS